MLKQYLETGEIVGTHGIKGEARVHPWSDTPDFLCGFKTFYLDDEGKGNLKVKSSRVHGNMVLIKFDGYDTIEQTEKLRGKVIYIKRSDAKLPDGRSFIQDIIGCEAFDVDTNQKLGKVPTYDKTIMQLGAAAVVLIPYIFLVEDLSAITVTPLILIMLLIVGVVHTGIAYALYFGSMNGLKAQTVALFRYIDPIVAIILSAMFLHEPMTIYSGIGAVLVLGATMISELPEKK